VNYLDFSISVPRVGLFLLAAILCTGCHHDEIVSYRIPKGTESLMPMPPAEISDQSPIKYELPAGWQTITPTGMSVAQFSIAGHQAEMSVMSFPGEGASQLNLVNIVRKNAGLPDLNQEQLAKIVEPVSVGDSKGSLINLSAATSASTTASSSNGVMVAVFPHSGVTWFFKLAGAKNVVAAQKPELLEFLKSVEFVAGAAPASLPPMADSANADTTQPPADATDATPPPAANFPTSDTSGKPSWQIPSTWKEVPPTAMLLAKFVIKNATGDADVTVSSFPGDVGGLLANINRWRGSVGQTPIEENDLAKNVTSLDVPGSKATLVDVTGNSSSTGKPERVIGVIWPRNGETWFFKMMGDASVAGGERDAFLKFIQSVHFPNG
jgi:hypothetical protein